jgi:hypothetical protein
MQFNINVVSEKEDPRIPVAVAGQTMVDIQSLFTHIGEYIISRELRIQGALSDKLRGKLTLYLDNAGGIGLASSPVDPTVTGYGSVSDDVVALMESALEAMGSGAGGYWIDDNFALPNYRAIIAADFIALSEHISGSGFVLEFGAEGAHKRFEGANIEKLKRYLRDGGRSAPGATSGVLIRSDMRSKKPSVQLKNGDTRARISFANPRAEMSSEPFIDRVPVIVSGMMMYTGDGKLAEIRGVDEVVELKTIKFRRMISDIGDVRLSSPVVSDVTYDGMKDSWKLSCEPLGISVTKSDWDSAVEAFHDYFVFLWETYAGKTEKELEGEDKDIRDSLLALL